MSQTPEFTDKVSLEWDYLVSPRQFLLEESSELAVGSKKIIVSRNAMLELHMLCEGNFKSKCIEAFKNKINNRDKKKFTNNYPSLKIKDEGEGSGHVRAFVNFYSVNHNISSSDECFLSQEAVVDDIHFQLNNSPPVCLTEWVFNLPTNVAWPLLFKRPDGSTSYDRLQISLETDSGLTLYFGKISSKGVANELNAGFLKYIFYGDQIPSEELRKQIRDALSFAIGRPLGYLGYTTYDKQEEIVGFHAINHMIGKVADFQDNFPAPLDRRHLGVSYNALSMKLDSEVVSKMVNYFVKNYAEFDLGYVMWRYWHACLASVDIVAVSFVSLLENLMQAHSQKNRTKIKTAFLEKELWEDLENKLLQVMSKVLPEDRNKTDIHEAKNVFINKIKNLNAFPISMRLADYFASIGLKLSKKEKDAIHKRNKYSHGGKPNNAENVFFENKVLRTLCNRVILRMTGAHEYYIDWYSTTGVEENYMPIRKLEEPIGG